MLGPTLLRYDCVIRRGNCHEILDVQSASIGLSTLLHGRQSHIKINIVSIRSKECMSNSVNPHGAPRYKSDKQDNSALASAPNLTQVYCLPQIDAQDELKQNRSGYLEEKPSLKGPMPEPEKKNQMSVYASNFWCQKSRGLFYSLV
jgi:hypothetical protein